MICTLTVRPLKPSSYDQFRAAREPAGAAAIKHAWTRIHHCQDAADPDLVIPLGLFNGTLKQLREAQEQIGRASQIDGVSPHIRDVLLDGSYQVLDALRKHSTRRGHRTRARDALNA